MALDPTILLAEAASEKARFLTIIRGLEDLSDDHMDPTQAQQILQFLGKFQSYAASIEKITSGLEEMVAQGYPKDPVLHISPEFKAKIEAEVNATKVADSLIVAAPSAVDGPLLFHAPMNKP